MEELNNLCDQWHDSDELSLATLREKISELSTGDVTEETYNEHPFLHELCMNKNVTLEMVECILDTFPSIASWLTYKMCPNYKTEGYPIHCACYNEHCPSSVIRLMLKQYAAATKWLATVGDGVHTIDKVKGLPLHYYLARTSIDMDIVKMLVEAYPQSLLVTDETWPLYPIHAAAYDSDPNDLSEIIEYFLELEPTCLRFSDGDGNTPLHLAFENKRMNLSTVELLVNSWPEAIRISGHGGCFPIHELCCNRTIEETSDAIAILRFMLDTDQTTVRERNREGCLPIHHAVHCKSLAFCKVLIDVYPESLSVRKSDGSLPIHIACDYYGSAAKVETIQYMLDRYPESINNRDGNSMLPIHRAAEGNRTDIVELLLKYDPDAAKKTTRSLHLPLHVTCEAINPNLDVAKALFDSYPQAINTNNGKGKTPFDLKWEIESRYGGFTGKDPSESVLIKFLLAQQEYDQKAKDTKVMHTPDENGWSPLHHALKDNAPRGSIKLLLNGNPSALMTADYNIAFPLHIACEFSSIEVVKYLIELDVSGRILNHCDTNKDSIFHYACRGGNLRVVKYFLDELTSLVASAEVNEKGELPIHLLCEAGKDKVDIDSDDSTEYVEVIWRMLLANPEDIMS